MSPEQRQRIINRHRHSIWQHGYGPQALYWENRQVQELRFAVLAECGIQTGDSLLDVGCGFADLYFYLKKQGIETNYTGIDLSPDMIESAQSSAPQLKLQQGDLFDFDPAAQSYDWVLLSGALNEPLQDNATYLHAMLPRLFATCRRGLAFNLLNAHYPWTAQQRYTLQPYAPDEVMSILRELSPHVQIRDDYLPVDVSYFVWREGGMQA